VSGPDEGELDPAPGNAPAAVAVAPRDESAAAAPPTAAGRGKRARRWPLHGARAPRAREQHEGAATWALELVDSTVYILVGVCFCVAALYSLGYSAYSFATQLIGRLQTGRGNWADQLFGSGQAGQDIITLVSDLLLTLIIMEVLGTVVHHLRDKETTLKPFLFIGIISATRGILAVGARLSVSTDAHITDDFIRNMIELGVNAVVIIALGAAMKLIGPLLEEGATTRGARRREAEARQHDQRTSAQPPR
jgi:hypothetical protein